MTRIALAAVLGAALLCSSCSLLGSAPEPSRFYVLAAMASTDAGAKPAPLSGVSVGIARLILPSYVSRQEIMRRVGPTQVRPSHLDNWAGPLESNVLRVLSQDLSLLLGTDRISTYPAYDVATASFQISVDVARFDLDEANQAHLIARWDVRTSGDKPRNISGMTDITHAAASPDTAAGVEALSQAMADLSRDIAGVVRELEAAPAARPAAARPRSRH